MMKKLRWWMELPIIYNSIKIIVVYRMCMLIIVKSLENFLM